MSEIVGLNWRPSFSGIEDSLRSYITLSEPYILPRQGDELVVPLWPYVNRGGTEFRSILAEVDKVIHKYDYAGRMKRELNLRTVLLLEQ
jgi:hypothetical protein